jgi:hypothetical protein
MTVRKFQIITTNVIEGPRERECVADACSNAFPTTFAD